MSQVIPKMANTFKVGVGKQGGGMYLPEPSAKPDGNKDKFEVSSTQVALRPVQLALQRGAPRPRCSGHVRARDREPP